jgi:hypothetical protein
MEKGSLNLKAPKLILRAVLGLRQFFVRFEGF